MHTTQAEFCVVLAVSLLVALSSPAVKGQPTAIEAAKLTASDASAEDWFGYSVSLGGNVAVVGAPQFVVAPPGAAYVYRFDGANWGEEAKLEPPPGAFGYFFGWSVAVGGNVALIGAFGDNAAYVYRFDGINWIEETRLTAFDTVSGDGFGQVVGVSDDVALVGAPGQNTNTGAAYVFRRDPTKGWLYETKLTASDANVGDEFGKSLSIDSGVALIGAWRDDDRGDDSGAAYVYRYSGGIGWREEAKLTASDGAAGDMFGRVSVSGNVAVVGALADDDAGASSGSAYVFRFNGVDWPQEAKLTASDATGSDEFGESVSVSGDVVVIGAYKDGATYTGAAYTYRFDGSRWQETAKLVASDAAGGDMLGRSTVSVSGNIALVGAHQNDDDGSNSGSAYVFDVPVSPPPTVQLDSATYSVTEIGKLVTITVTISEAPSVAARVEYSTYNTGSALAGIDYVETSGTLTWLPADGTSRTFDVPILHDSLPETTEVFDVRLLGGEGVAIGSPGTATVSIVDHPGLSPNDFGPAADRIDFDDLGLGHDVRLQLTMRGVIPRSADGSPITVVDATAMGGNQPHSQPYAVMTSPAGLPLELKFSAPRSEVGMYFGNLDVSTTARLRAYDDREVLLDEVAIEVDRATAGDIGMFIGVGVTGLAIHRVTLGFDDVVLAASIDDLLVEPGQNDHPAVAEAVIAASLTLDAPDSTLEEKLAAIQTLQLNPSMDASLTLQQAARRDPDLYVRERAVFALAQFLDPNSRQSLVSIGLDPPNDAVKRAAYNAVSLLNQAFPMPDPPAISVAAITPIRGPGMPFDVEVSIVSPVNRDSIHITARYSKEIHRDPTSDLIAYSGRVLAGEELLIRGTVIPESVGQWSLPLSVVVSRDLVDVTTYTVPLYVDVQEATGSASMTPFPGMEEDVQHIQFLGGTSAGVVSSGSLQSHFDSGVKLAGEYCNPYYDRFGSVTGRILYQDGDPTGGTGFNPILPAKPARLVKVTVADALGVDCIYGIGHTHSDGRFNIASWLPDNRSVRLILEVDNYVNRVLLDTDWEDDSFLAATWSVPTGPSGDVSFGEFTVPADYIIETIDEGMFIGSYEIAVSFAGALNINEVILTTRDDVDANRGDADSIEQVTVEYCDSTGSMYWSDLSLACGQIDGVNQGADNGYVDRTIAHEYAHHLQYAIGEWDAHSGGHSFCEEVDHLIWADEEFAWSEGFADYVGGYIVRRYPNMSMVNTRDLEDACASVDPYTSDDGERSYSVEGHVAGVLWDLTDGLGSENMAGRFPITEAISTAPIWITSANHGLQTGHRVRVSGVTVNTAANGDHFITRVDSDQFILNGSDGRGFGTYQGVGGTWRAINRDPWDRVDGDAVNGHRQIMQIFDDELGYSTTGLGDAPDLRDFYEAWVDRTGLDWADGRQALDAILNAVGIVPGGEFDGLQKMTPRILIEANPILPDQVEASLADSGASVPQYTQPAEYTPPPTQPLPVTPTPTLTIRRQHSFLDGTPMAFSPNALADQIDVGIGVTNLGVLTMEVDAEGAAEEGDSADYTTSITYLPDSTSNWLSVDPSVGSVSGNTGARNLAEYDDVTIAFQSLAYDLSEGSYQADVNVEFVINEVGGGSTAATETIRIDYTVLDGPQDDADGDGLTNFQEKMSCQGRVINGQPCVGPGDCPSGQACELSCLNPRESDTDGDEVDDPVELATGCMNPCLWDTDGDTDPQSGRCPSTPCPSTMSDGVEFHHSCLNPCVCDSCEDPDEDGLSNAEELAFTYDSVPTDPCDDDTEKDGAPDGDDNCPVSPNGPDLGGCSAGNCPPGELCNQTCSVDADCDSSPGSSDGVCSNQPSPNQDDLDGDGVGDVCDRDADGDGCVKRFDPNDLSPDNVCPTQPVEPAITRTGRFLTIDPRWGDPRLRVLLDGIRPQGPDSCGPERCPPPGLAVFLDNFSDALFSVRSTDFGFGDESGFASSAQVIPDWNRDGIPEVAVGVPNAKLVNSSAQVPWSFCPAGRGLSLIASMAEAKRVHWERACLYAVTTSW